MSDNPFIKATSIEDIRHLNTRLLRNYGVIERIRSPKTIRRDEYESIKDILYRNMAYLVRCDEHIEEELLMKNPSSDAILGELYVQKYYAEKMVLSLREALCSLPKPIVDGQEISYEHMDCDYDAEVSRFMGGYRILSGARFPSKNTILYARNKYWWEPIQQAVSMYCNEHRPIQRLGASVVCYIDRYPEEFKKSNIYDADNVDIKPVNDCLMDAFLLSDVSTELSIYQTGVIDQSVEAPMTEILLVPKDKLPEVIHYLCG